MHSLNVCSTTLVINLSIPSVCLTTEGWVLVICHILGLEQLVSEGYCGLSVVGVW